MAQPDETAALSADEELALATTVNPEMAKAAYYDKLYRGRTGMMVGMNAMNIGTEYLNAMRITQTELNEKKEIARLKKEKGIPLNEQESAVENAGNRATQRINESKRLLTTQAAMDPTNPKILTELKELDQMVQEAEITARTQQQTASAQKELVQTERQAQLEQTQMGREHSRGQAKQKAVERVLGEVVAPAVSMSRPQTYEAKLQSDIMRGELRADKALQEVEDIQGAGIADPSAPTPEPDPRVERLTSRATKQQAMSDEARRQLLGLQEAQKGRVAAMPFNPYAYGGMPQPGYGHQPMGYGMMGSPMAPQPMGGYQPMGSGRGPMFLNGQWVYL